jgi:hypothetical protein
MKAACTGWSCSPLANPSIVVISLPSAVTASVRQETTRFPLTRTVHAPQDPRSQPFLVPVKCNLFRIASNKVTRGSRLSFSGRPLILNERSTVGTLPSFGKGPASFGSCKEAPRPTGAATVSPAESAANRPRNSLRDDPVDCFFCDSSIESDLIKSPFGISVTRFLSSPDRNRAASRNKQPDPLGSWIRSKSIYSKQNQFGANRHRNFASRSPETHSQFWALGNKQIRKYLLGRIHKFAPKPDQIHKRSTK